MFEQNYFVFVKEPFATDVKVEELYRAPFLAAATERILYVVKLGAVSLVSGEVGSRKSTTLHYGASRLHPSPPRVILVIGSTGYMVEML